MLYIKLILYNFFKVKNEEKNLFLLNSETELEQIELKKLAKKRNALIHNYIKRYCILFIVTITISVFFGYACVCYAGVFKNSVGGIIFSTFISLILSMIISAFISFMICLLYKAASSLDNKCMLSVYYALKTVY